MKRWTEQEDNILRKNVDDAFKANLSLEQALKNTVVDINRPLESCRKRYYYKLKPTMSVNSKQVSKKVVEDDKKDTATKKTNKRWTAEEDNCLRNQIELNINCLEDGFAKTARLTGRSVGACRTRWYSKVSLQPPYYWSVVSKGQQIINRRFPTRPSLIKKRTNTWWQKMCKLLGFSK